MSGQGNVLVFSDRAALHNPDQDYRNSLPQIIPIYPKEPDPQLKARVENLKLALHRIRRFLTGATGTHRAYPEPDNTYAGVIQEIEEEVQELNKLFMAKIKTLKKKMSMNKKEFRRFHANTVKELQIEYHLHTFALIKKNM